MIKANHMDKIIGQTKILSDICLEIPDGEFISISGRSGSGKSTLLYILGTLDEPSNGNLSIDGFETNTIDENELHNFRNQQVGFVFQFHYLLPELTAIENILMPARKQKKHLQLEERAHNLLEKFDIANMAYKFPSQLSGGEQQRVAIARALIMQPKYIFADEPTGNLDVANGDTVMNILQAAHQEQGATLVLVTHEPEYSKLAQREIFLVDGRIEDMT